jgi:Cft2 family RNA processing exonuclease
MCPPAALTLTAGQVATAQAVAAVGSSLLSIRSQRQQAAMQAESQRAATRNENIRFRQEMTARRAAEAQQNQIAAGEVQEVVRRTREAKATARVSAAESGVTGLSVDQLMQKFERQQAQSLFAIQEQQRFNSLNSTLQDEQSTFRSQQNLSRINQPIEQPNYVGEAFSLAQQGLGIYRGYQTDTLTDLETKLKTRELKKGTD